MEPSMKLSLEEMETHFNMVGNDRSTFHVYSDDPVMIARLERKGHVAKGEDSIGKYFEIPANLITFRNVPTPEQAERRRELGRQKAKHLRSESHSPGVR